jgi:hypothetical protein
MKVVIDIYRKGKHIASQDVSDCRPDEVDEIVRIKAEYGLECRLKGKLLHATTEYEGKAYCIDEGWQEQKDCKFAEISTLTGECFWKLSDGRCNQKVGIVKQFFINEEVQL